MRNKFEENNVQIEEDIKNKKSLLSMIKKDLDYKQSILNSL